MSDRPFVSAQRAADLLGVPVAAVIADIVRGYEHCDSLTGGEFGEAWIVYAYEFEGERLAMHQARLQVPHV